MLCKAVILTKINRREERKWVLPTRGSHINTNKIRKEGINRGRIPSHDISNEDFVEAGHSFSSTTEDFFYRRGER